MKVYFKYPWFAPGEPIVKDRRKFSGQQFRRGLQEVPEHLLELLPKSAKVITPGTVVPSEPIRAVGNPVETLRDHDVDRQAAEIVADREQKIMDGLAKARMVRAQKVAARKTTALAGEQ